VLRYRLAGKAHNMGLGPYPDVGLAEARALAGAARGLLRKGIDPIEQRRRDRAAARLAAGRTFAEVAAEYIERNRAGWANAKHAAQWASTIETYAAPQIGRLGVADIALRDVLAVLEPIWTTKPETASRVRGRIEAVLDYAGVQGWRTGDNPARWRGFLDQLLPDRAKVAPVVHHAALPWREMPDFWRALQLLKGPAAIALRWSILTACRSGEARGARWNEIDMQAAVWTIPAARMKAKKEHRVPLVPAMLQILADVRPFAGTVDSLVFPGQKSRAPLSDAAVSKVLDRLGRSDITVHGFRSTFRDWIGDHGTFAPDLAEAALAHTLGSKVATAYQRGDLLERRRKMMAAWCAYVTGEPQEIGEVPPMAG
jgi:integrase